MHLKYSITDNWSRVQFPAGDLGVAFFRNWSRLGLKHSNLPYLKENLLNNKNQVVRSPDMLINKLSSKTVELAPAELGTTYINFASVL